MNSVPSGRVIYFLSVVEEDVMAQYCTHRLVMFASGKVEEILQQGEDMVGALNKASIHTVRAVGVCSQVGYNSLRGVLINICIFRPIAISMLSEHSWMS